MLPGCCAGWVEPNNDVVPPKPDDCVVADEPNNGFDWPKIDVDAVEAG